MATPITPNTIVHLLKCPLEIDNNHQMNFASKTAQFNYFNSLPKKTYDEFSYQRQDGVLRINDHIDNIIGYNYVMYQNENYSNKWFYAFITNMEYVNDNCTFVSIKTDVVQTWWFDLSFHSCFVEREHVNDDTFGLHTVPENLEYGDYVCTEQHSRKYVDPNDTNSTIVAFLVTTTTLSNGTFPHSTKGVNGGIPQGLQLFGFRLRDSNIGYLYSIIGAYDSDQKGDAIVSICLMPDMDAWETAQGTGSYATWENLVIPADSWGAWMNETAFYANRPSALNGYVPKNNKMYTQPYCYFHISNHAGSDISYAYENFDGTPTFYEYSTLSQNGTIALVPYNSKKSSNATHDKSLSYDEAVFGAKLPNVSWASDYYLNWQAVNGKNLAVQTQLNALNFIGGLSIDLAMKSPSGSGMGGVGFAQSIANALTQQKQAEMTPPQAKGTVYNADLGFSMGRLRFECYQMTIRYEYAKIIDDYFSAYGYKVNAYKTPNITGRQNWNYIKLQDANITGNIPQEDMNEIKGYFNRGITIWHNPSTYLDYTQTNNITS